MTLQNSKSLASSGIKLELLIGRESESRPIGVASNHLERAGVDRVAESQGGPGDRDHEEGLPQCVAQSRQVIFANLGARVATIVSA